MGRGRVGRRGKVSFWVEVKGATAKRFRTIYFASGAVERRDLQVNGKALSHLASGVFVLGVGSFLNGVISVEESAGRTGKKRFFCFFFDFFVFGCGVC